MDLSAKFQDDRIMHIFYKRDLENHFQASEISKYFKILLTRVSPK